MEKIFFVENGDLREVNKCLSKGGTVKSVHPINQNIAAYGFGGGETCYSDHGKYEGDVYAYVVVEI